MKKVLSLILVAAMLFTLLAVTPVSAASSAVGSGKMLFCADFDGVNPETVKLDSNAVFENSDYGKALKITTADDGAGNNMKTGAYYAVDSFSHNNAMLKFDLKHNAGYHFHGTLWDSNGVQKTFRLKKTDMTTNAWYTYVIDVKNRVGYRKLKGATEWEDGLVVAYNDPGTTDSYTNTLKLGSGSKSSNNDGIWYVDNVVLFDGTPAANVIVPENVSTPNVNYAYNEDFEGTANSITTGHPVGADPDDAENSVMLYDLTGSKEINKYGGTARTKEFKFPADGTPYTINFDLRVEGCNTDDYIWVQTRDAVEYSCARMPMSQFVKNEWYTISYTLDGKGTGETKSALLSAAKVLKKDGTSSALTMSLSTGWTGQKDKICITTYNGNGGGYVVDETTGTTPWTNVKYLIDNLSFTYESAKSIDAEVFTIETSGSIKPVIAAYDENGVLTATAEADKKDLEAIMTYGGTASASFDIVNSVKAFEDAASVKVLFWNSIEAAKAYTDAVEIGDKIAEGATVSTVVAKEIDITDEMIPEGAAGKYTVAAYAVPFTVAEGNIPDFDASKHTLLALKQSDSAIDSIAIDSSLYSGEEQDIVIVCNAEGATSPVVTLYEENDAPQFKNVAMLLGRDITERNFTWYSLDNSKGKITYQKKSEMIDGEFTEGAVIVDAARCHDDNVYSTKEYYYQNEASITGLEPGETYVYQLSNGTAKSDKYTIKIGEKKTSFSFLFSGDPQVGGNDNANYDQEHTYWGRTVKQMVSAPEFEGVDFFLSGGDQVESGSTVGIIEDQYDIYLEHEEFRTFPMAVTAGNHDAKAAGMHMQHFNEPNKIINPATGTYYGASPKNSTEIDGVDYYYIYNSVLFMHLNLNTFDDMSNGTAEARADDKADAEEHAEFINAVLEETKDNKDILWKIVYCHQSPFGGSYHGNYTKKSNGTYNRTEQYDYINIREYLVPYLYEADIDLVLSGHDHTYTRTHIIKPNENDDILGDELNSMVISPYANTEGANYYTYADGTTTPTFETWTDRAGNVWDGSAENRPYLKVKSVPVKVTDPDGFLWVTGGSSSGSQTNNAEYPNHYAAVCQMINQRAMSRIDVTPNSLKLVTYNIGTNELNNDPLKVVDEFEIVKTASIPVSGITLEESATIAVGQTKTLNAVLTPVEPSNNAVAWESDNDAVATVENGVVTAKAAGVANIKVTTADGGFTATCVVTVVDAVPVTAITLPEAVTMEALTTKTIGATVAPETATTKALRWTSNNESVATVDEKGNVTAYLNGEVVITATATDGSGISASCVVTVTYVPMTRFELSASSLKLNVMDVTKLTYSYAPSNATFKDITWSSSAPEVVLVDEKGQIEALRVGTATITAKNVVGETATCTVVAEGGVNSLDTFEGDAQMLKPASTTAEKFWTKVKEEDGNTVYAFDGSEYTRISNLDAPLDSGMYNIPLADSGHTIAFDYKRISEDGYPALEFKTYTHDGIFGGVRFVVKELEKDVWYNVKLVYTDTDGWVKYYKKATDAEYSIQSNDISYAPQNHTSGTYFDRIYLSPAVAKASNDMNNGSDNSAAARTERAKKTKFRIDNIKFSTDVPMTAMTLAENSVNLEIGENAKISPVFAPSNATDTNVTYVSDNTAVATVDRHGKVTAVNGGNATITAIAADGGFTATYSVTVKKVEPVISVQAIDGGFKVSTNVAVDGKKVYVAAYDASDRMIIAASEDYVATGTNVIISADGASYYKAFIFGTDAVPVIAEKLFD